MGESLTSKTLGGLVWSYISVLVTACFQILYTAIMARLLAPSIFGIVAMANIILGFGSYFSRMGIGPALVQKKDLTEDDIRAAFTSSLLISSFVTLAVILLAPLARLIFDNDEVVPVVRAMAISLFVVGTTSTASYLLRRNFQFRSLMIAEIISFIVGVVVGIFFALIGFGVWSLVICNLIQASGVGLISYMLSPHSLKLSFDWSKYKGILSYGGQLSLVSFFEFINYSLDTMVIGHFLGPTLLGIYNRSYYIVSLPSQQISSSLTKVLFSSLSKIQAEVEKLRVAYQTLILVLGIVLFAFGFSISAAAREIVYVLLGPKWGDAVPVLRILALAVPFTMLVIVNGIMFDATARLRIKIIMVLARLAFLISLFTALFKFGLIGFSLAYLITEVIYYSAQTAINKQFLSIPTKNILSLHIPIFSTAALEFLVLSGITWYFNAQHAFAPIILAVQIVTSGTVLICVVLIWPPRILASLLHNVLNRMDKNRVPPTVYNIFFCLISRRLLPKELQ